MPVDAGDIAHEALRIWLESDRRRGIASGVVYRRTIDAMQSLLGDRRNECHTWQRVEFECVDCETPASWLEAFEAVRDYRKPPIRCLPIQRARSESDWHAGSRLTTGRLRRTPSSRRSAGWRGRR